MHRDVEGGVEAVARALGGPTTLKIGHGVGERTSVGGALDDARMVQVQQSGRRVGRGRREQLDAGARDLLAHGPHRTREVRSVAGRDDPSDPFSRHARLHSFAKVTHGCNGGKTPVRICDPLEGVGRLGYWNGGVRVLICGKERNVAPLEPSYVDR